MPPDEQPKLTNSQVKKAGDHLRRRLRDVGDLKSVSADATNEWAWGIVERYVATHYDPMVDLVRSASAISREFGVGDPVSRIKRSERIIEKIARSKSSLSSLQDIGGLRIVVPSLAYQYELAGRLAELAYPLIRLDDYASAPGASPLVADSDGAKGSGYRAVHLVHEVRGRKIETQVRTQVQHAWAAAAERAEQTTGAPIKFGEGPLEILDFFRVLSQSLALQELDFPADIQLNVELDEHLDQFLTYYRDTDIPT